MEALQLAIMGAVNIACFLIGAKIGKTVTRGETVMQPKMNPIKAVQEHRSRKQAQQKQSRLDTILQNIESYDGTGYGQKDVPGR